LGLADVVSARLAETRAAAASGEEHRVIGGVPWRPWDDPYWRFNVGGPVHPSRQVGGIAGQDAGLRLFALYGVVRFLADGVAQIPIEQYRDTPDDGRQPMPLGQLLQKPSAYLNRYDWLFQYVSSAALHGTAWGLIAARNDWGYPTTVEWLPPEQMVVEDPTPWNPSKARYFFGGRSVDPSQLLIVRAFTVPGRTAGISPLQYFQSLIESGLAALDYGNGWYGSGGVPPGTFQNTAYELEDDQSAKVKRMLVAAQRRREPLVYGRDWEYKPIAVPPNQAQFIEAMQLNATQIASIYGVDPKRVGGMTGDSMTYSNAEMNMIAEQTDALDPWLYRLETALENCLPARQYARFDRDARLRMTAEARWGIYQIARNIGGMNIDEIRKKEHMKPLPPPGAKGWDGEDYTPLQVAVAAARGANTLLGEGSTGSVAGNAPGGPPAPAKPAGPPMPATRPLAPPAKVNGSNGNGNGSAPPARS
jgi:HK97 family phage portal protein